MQFTGNLNLDTACIAVHGWRRENRGLKPSHIVIHPGAYNFLRYDIHKRGFYHSGQVGIMVMGIPVLASYEIEEKEILIGNLT